MPTKLAVSRCASAMDEIICIYGTNSTGKQGGKLQEIGSRERWSRWKS